MDKSCGVCVEDDTDDDDDDDDDLEAGNDDDDSGTGYHLHHRRSGDQKLKDKALSTIHMNVPRTCNCGNKCLSKATIIETIKLRENYWGTNDEEAPSSKTRGLLNFQILSHFYSAALNDFQFCITNYDHSNVLVCEAAYLILLGYINTPNASHASNQWKRIKSWLKSTKSSDRSYDMYKADSDRKKRSLNEGAKVKLNHALTFIVNYAKEFGDRIPSKEG